MQKHIDSVGMYVCDSFEYECGTFRLIYNSLQHCLSDRQSVCLLRGWTFTKTMRLRAADIEADLAMQRRPKCGTTNLVRMATKSLQYCSK